MKDFGYTAMQSIICNHQYDFNGMWMREDCYNIDEYRHIALFLK
jgi:hypothetical protein